MSQDNFRHENDPSLNRRSEGKATRRNSTEGKPFTGFTSPYKKLNEQQLLEKKQQCDNRTCKRNFTGFTSSRGGEAEDNSSSGRRHTLASMRKCRYSDEYKPRDLITSSFNNRAFETRSRWHHSTPKALASRPDSKSDRFNDPHTSSQKHKCTKKAETNICDSKSVKRMNEESVYGKVSWAHDTPAEQRGQMNFEKPMNPSEFREQCRKTYLQATAERRRNAEIGLWGKCEWATYDRGSRRKLR